MMKWMLILAGILFVTKAVLAADKKVEMDESDLSKKVEAGADEQPLKVQDNLPTPQRMVNLRLIQNQVLNLNLSDKELEETDAPIEE
jgi:hypothetical protein